MAGRFLSLFKVVRGKRKKDTGAAPAQQPEEPEQFQPLQDDAAMDRTQEQDPSLGRFRRTLKMFRKFVPIQRRKSSTTATESTAKPDSGLTELQAEPDVSPDSSELSEKFDTAVTENWEEAFLMSMTEDVAITDTISGETQGLTKTETSPDLAEHSEDSDSAMNDHRPRTDVEVTEDMAITNSSTGVAITDTVNEETQGMTKTETSPDLAECSEDFDSAMNDHRAKADIEVIEDVATTNADTGVAQDIANTDTMPTPTVIHAPSTDFFEERGFASQQVPVMVKNIHQSLTSHVTVGARLATNILKLAEKHPVDVVLTLLRCAPSCDRAAAMMWRTIASSGPTMKKVLAILLCVMEDWPLHSMCTSDGDNKTVFSLAATLVLWVIIQVPECHEAMILYSARLFVALLFHVVITTQQMPPVEVDIFWRACQEEHRLPSNPNRFAVQAMKALLCCLHYDSELMAMERKRGWDTLLCADTQHYAVGLLAREMHGASLSLCSGIALRLLRLLSREEPCWDLPFLPFLVEVLDCLDLRERGDSILEIMSMHLQNECRQRRRLALRGLMVLSKDPSMAIRMCSLSQSLLELLGDADRDVLGMTLHVFTNMLKNKDILISSTT
ncbi:uncharacterized protein LOC111944640, partial [Cyanistes caeruleus]|uniref:uncharacterized protein LOC111944640 n=1 Tax=Cyanistes caeruleus TaxID=156563 RepID=UPI000CDB3E71